MAKRHEPEEIITKLRQVDVLVSQGSSVAEAIRSIGVTEVTYYRWRQEYGGLKSDQVKRMKVLARLIRWDEAKMVASVANALMWHRILVLTQSPIHLTRCHARHGRRYGPVLRLSSRRTEENHSRLRRRSPHFGRRRHAAVAGGAAPRDRQAAGLPDPGPARSDPRHPQLPRHDPGPHLRHLLRLRGRRGSRHPAHRPRLQARLRTPARHRGRSVLAADPVAAGECASLARRDPADLRPGGRLDGLLPAGARGGDARHRSLS